MFELKVIKLHVLRCHVRLIFPFVGEPRLFGRRYRSQRVGAVEVEEKSRVFQDDTLLFRFFVCSVDRSVQVVSAYPLDHFAQQLLDEWDVDLSWRFVSDRERVEQQSAVDV